MIRKKGFMHSSNLSQVAWTYEKGLATLINTKQVRRRLFGERTSSKHAISSGSRNKKIGIPASCWTEEEELARVLYVVVPDRERIEFGILGMSIRSTDVSLSRHSVFFARMCAPRAIRLNYTVSVAINIPLTTAANTCVSLAPTSFPKRYN